MRRLITLVLIAAALWSGYWFIGKSTKQNVLEAWFEDRKAAGWTAEYSDFQVVGFPNRFDSRFTDLNLRTPITGIGWQAPRFHILALSYKPNHIIAAFANHQTLSLPLEEIIIDSSEMLASVVFQPDTKLALSRVRLHSSDLALSGNGWQAKAGNLTLSTRQTAGLPLAHDIVFDANSVTPTKALRQNLDPRGNLPATIDTVFLDMVLSFNNPWDRIALETGMPEVTRIDLKQMDLGWGKLGLSATGILDVAPNGTINGKLSLNIKNWRDVLALTVTSRLLDQNTANTISSALSFLTLGSVDPDNLTMPLELRDGRMSLGPIPLGNAPRFTR